MNERGTVLVEKGLIAVAVTMWLVITVLSLLPGTERPHTGFSGNLEHSAAYIGTGAVTALVFPRIRVLWLTLPFSLASCLFEVAQIYIPGRRAGIDNWAASTLGALTGVLIARYLVAPMLVSLWRARGRTD